MPPNVTPEVQFLMRQVAILESRLNAFERGDRFYFKKDIEIPKEIGIKIGTASTQKMAFWGATPVDRPATVSDPTGGVTQDAEGRLAINAIIDRLQEIGLLA